MTHDLDRLVGQGYRLTYTEGNPGWFADLRDAGGRCTETGCGATQEMALEHLAERLGRRAGLEEPEDTPAVSAGKRVRLPDPWLPAWCPRWCDWDHDHTEWTYEDRRHRSQDLDVILSAMNMIVDEVQGEVSFTPRRLSASLEAHYRETEPRVCIAHGDEPEAVVYATLDEAEEHARHLLSLVTQARAG